MKKSVVLIIALFLISIAAYFLFFNKNSGNSSSAGTPLEPVELSPEKELTNKIADPYFNAYFNLKDALVNTDANAANEAATQLIAAGKALDFSNVEAGQAIIDNIGHYTTTIESSSNALIAEADIEAKRKEFEIISDAFWNLGQVFQYSGQKVYYQYCPMAFDDKGAYWISNSPEIRNPYFGDKMLKCGTVKDSLSY